MNKVDLNQHTTKAYLAGTHRSRTPAETLADYSRHMPRIGITRLANITGLDRIGLPVVVAVRPNSRSLATSQGKGDSLEAAKASALLESIEMWHAERCEAPIRFESWYEIIAGHAQAPDPFLLPLRKGVALDRHRPIPWAEGYNLRTGRSTWVPYESVTVNFVFQAGHNPCFVQSSNGLASGNQFCEAVLHGLCEVIERDAWNLWEVLPASKKKQRQVDLDTVQSPVLHRTLETLRSAGLIAAAWDITADIEVPVYHAVVIENPQSPHWRPIVTSAGHGAHLDPEIALSRSINEAIQCRLTMIAGSRDDKFPADYRVGSSRFEHEAVIRMISEPPPARPVGLLRPPVAEHFEADIQTVLDALERAGVGDVVVVDLSRADLGIPVVKVVVPGLEGPPTPFTSAGRRKRAWKQRYSQ
jgi:YcaO-like protein with predicted kinase domain